MNDVFHFFARLKTNDDGHIKTRSKKISHHKPNVNVHADVTTKTTFCRYIL